MMAAILNFNFACLIIFNKKAVLYYFKAFVCLIQNKKGIASLYAVHTLIKIKNK